MTTMQDCSIGFKKETTYKTGVTVDRWLAFLDESLDWKPARKQGSGLRVGRRLPLSGRRTTPTADGGGDVTYEMLSKGMGTLLELAVGQGTSTLLSGSTYQQVFTLADVMASATTQKGIPRADGTVDAYTFLGSTIPQFEFNVPNADIVTFKPSWDLGDLTTATAYAAPSYASEPVSLYHFGGAAISTGTLTLATTNALASATTPLTGVRDFNLQVNHQPNVGRFNFGGAGRKDKPLTGERQITGTITQEYVSTTFRDAILNDTPMPLLLDVSTPQALSTGTERLQVALAECKFDSELVKSKGGDLSLVPLKFTVLENLVASAALQVILRTADTAL